MLAAEGDQGGLVAYTSTITFGVSCAGVVDVTHVHVSPCEHTPCVRDMLQAQFRARNSGALYVCFEDRHVPAGALYQTPNGVRGQHRDARAVLKHVMRLTDVELPDNFGADGEGETPGLEAVAGVICKTKAEGNHSIKHPEGEYFKLGAQDGLVKGAVDTLGDAQA